MPGEKQWKLSGGVRQGIARVARNRLGDDSGLGFVCWTVCELIGRQVRVGDDVSAESLSLVAIRHVKHKATLKL